MYLGYTVSKRPPTQVESFRFDKPAKSLALDVGAYVQQFFFHALTGDLQLFEHSDRGIDGVWLAARHLRKQPAKPSYLRFIQVEAENDKTGTNHWFGYCPVNVLDGTSHREFNYMELSWPQSNVVGEAPDARQHVKQVLIRRSMDSMWWTALSVEVKLRDCVVSFETADDVKHGRVDNVEKLNSESKWQSLATWWVYLRERSIAVQNVLSNKHSNDCWNELAQALRLDVQESRNCANRVWESLVVLDHLFDDFVKQADADLLWYRRVSRPNDVPTIYNQPQQEKPGSIVTTEDEAIAKSKQGKRRKSTRVLKRERKATENMISPRETVFFTTNDHREIMLCCQRSCKPTILLQKKTLKLTNNPDIRFTVDDFVRSTLFEQPWLPFTFERGNSRSFELIDIIYDPPTFNQGKTYNIDQLTIRFKHSKHETKICEMRLYQKFLWNRMKFDKFRISQFEERNNTFVSVRGVNDKVTLAKVQEQARLDAEQSGTHFHDEFAEEMNATADNYNSGLRIAEGLQLSKYRWNAYSIEFECHCHRFKKNTGNDAPNKEKQENDDLSTRSDDPLVQDIKIATKKENNPTYRQFDQKRKQGQLAPINDDDIINDGSSTYMKNILDTTNGDDLLYDAEVDPLKRWMYDTFYMLRRHKAMTLLALNPLWASNDDIIRDHVDEGIESAELFGNAKSKQQTKSKAQQRSSTFKPKPVFTSQFGENATLESIQATKLAEHYKSKYAVQMSLSRHIYAVRKMRQTQWELTLQCNKAFLLNDKICCTHGLKRWDVQRAHLVTWQMPYDEMVFVNHTGRDYDFVVNGLPRVQIRSFQRITLAVWYDRALRSACLPKTMVEPGLRRHFLLSKSTRKQKSIPINMWSATMHLLAEDDLIKVLTRRMFCFVEEVDVADSNVLNDENLCYWRKKEVNTSGNRSGVHSIDMLKTNDILFRDVLLLRGRL